MARARRLIGSGNQLERGYGYSRAVVQGDWCFVAGTTGRDPMTGAVPDGVAEQAQLAFDIIDMALAEGGFALSDVVRATYYLADIADAATIQPVLAHVFGTVRPAATLVAVAALIAPELRVEIEVTALRAG